MSKQQWGRNGRSNRTNPRARMARILEGFAIGMVILVIGYGVAIVWYTIPDDLPVVVVKP